MDFKKLMDEVKNYTFCYASAKGQGFVRKDQCACKALDLKECNAIRERNQFFKRFEELKSQGLERPEIIDKIVEEMGWEETHWMKYNVRR